MLQLNAAIPDSLHATLEARAKQTGRGVSSIVTTALAQYLEHPLHTIFQVSTSGALVAGVDDQEVTVSTLLQHGDFGLGTFADLDGEMAVLDGKVYQIQGSGKVSEASPDAGAPFAVVTAFEADSETFIEQVTSFADLEAKCDPHRGSANIFYALRLDGRFNNITTRAVNPPQAGVGLADASKTQTEFTFDDIEGTLVGIWSPGFSSAFSVPGYHMHFLSADRQHGGHVLKLEAERLRLRIEALTDFHLVLPESESFLKADLGRDTSQALAYAEQAH